MDAVEALESLELLGSDHWGLVTSKQARENGISRLWLQRLNDRGVLQRLRHGVYALPSSQPGFIRDVQGAWLSIASTTVEQEFEGNTWPVVVSGASAAAIHEIGDLIPPYIEFSVPQRRISKQNDVRLIRRALRTQDVVVIDGLPTTSVERTIHDLSVTATDLDHLTTLVVDAARLPRASAAGLSNALARRAKKEGRTSGLELLEDMLATQGLDIDSVGLSSNFTNQVNQLAVALMSPALRESVRKSFASIAEGQKNLIPQISKAMSELAKPYMTDLSIPTEQLIKLALKVSSNDTDQQEHLDHDDQQDRKEE